MVGVVCEHHLGVVLREEGREGLVLGAVQHRLNLQHRQLPVARHAVRVAHDLPRLNLHLVDARCGLSLLHSDAVRVLSRIEPVGHRRQLCRVETDAEVGPQLLVERLDGHVLASKAVQADATAVWIVVLRARVDYTMSEWRSRALYKPELLREHTYWLTGTRVHRDLSSEEPQTDIQSRFHSKLLEQMTLV